MDQELSKIESYSKAFAEKTVNSFFSTKEVIRGQEILSFSSIDQVNLFIVKNLFVRWKEELNNLKSPFFDYENIEVQDALIQFMNTVSKHIAIKKEFFKPLVEKATYETLLLILKPAVYFNTEFPVKVSPAQMKEQQKYYKVHKQFLEAISGRFQGEIGRDEISKNFESQIGNTSESEKQEYISKFSTVLTFEPLNESPKTSAVAQEPKKEIPVPIVEQKLPIKENVIKQVERIPEPINVPQSPATINEKFSATQLTLNDILRQNEAKTIADKISKSRIENIRTAISLNQKFQFVNYLFKGIPSDYENALDDVDRCNNFEEAMNILNRNYAARFHWDYNNVEVKEFVEIIERKFS